MIHKEGDTPPAPSLPDFERTLGMPVLAKPSGHPRQCCGGSGEGRTASPSGGEAAGVQSGGEGGSELHPKRQVGNTALGRPKSPWREPMILVEVEGWLSGVVRAIRPGNWKN